MNEILLLVAGAAIGFVVAVVKRTFEARQECYANALRLAAQYMSSKAFSVSGIEGKAERPSSLEINQAFSQLLVFSRRGSTLPKRFLDFFCEKDGDRILTTLWPELLKNIRRELWVVFMPDIPEKVLFRWDDEHK